MVRERRFAGAGYMYVVHVIVLTYIRVAGPGTAQMDGRSHRLRAFFFFLLFFFFFGLPGYRVSASACAGEQACREMRASESWPTRAGSGRELASERERARRAGQLYSRLGE